MSDAGKAYWHIVGNKADEHRFMSGAGEAFKSALERPITQAEFDSIAHILGATLGMRVIRRYQEGQEPLLLMLPKKDGSHVLEMLQDLVTEMHRNRKMIMAFGEWMGLGWDPTTEKWDSAKYDSPSTSPLTEVIDGP